jgi:tol-pal system protein YbgF
VDELAQRMEALGRQAPASGAAPVPAPARAGTAPAPAVVAVPPPARAGAGAEESYQAAYLDFSKGLYPLAVSGFRDFLRRFPDSTLADSAQYWIGEAYFSMARATAGQPEKARENLEQAVQEFRKVVVGYPRGSKVPTALYKEALALVELKQTALAQARLQYLVEHFPQSEEAPLAKERLAGLKE